MAALIVVLSLAITTSTPGQDPAPDSRSSLRDLASLAGGVLSARCLECHNASEPSGGLDLSSRGSALRGGDTGSGLDDNVPLKSLLWKRIDDREMPPDHPLTDHERDVVKRWLQAGAAWPAEPLDPFAESTDRRAGRDWWSWQPRQDVEAPSVNHDRWSWNALDRFILESLQRHGLQSSRRADPRTLVRRLHFDLIGLPPDPEVVEAFERDPSEVRWGQLVDKLLATPQYAEHWGNHWLDIVRFGESNGFEYNQPREGAWRYRDWVVDALNRDLPYDQFVRLQIAGDSIAGPTLHGLAPLGFLVAGPHNTVLGISDAMRASARQDQLEEIAGMLGQAFLGLTVHCARCHDHKFDPITAREYYRFISNIAGVTHGNRVAASDLPEDTKDSWLATREQLQQQLHRSYRARKARLSHSANRLWTILPAGANRPGETYRIVYDVSPTVWADASQATRSDDALQVSVLGKDQQVLGSQSVAPGDWIAFGQRQNFRAQSFEYQGDGTGELVLELASSGHHGRFAGAMDFIECQDANRNVVWREDFHPTAMDPEPGRQSATGLQVHCRREFEGWESEGLNAAHVVEHRPGEFALQIFGGWFDASVGPETEDEKRWAAGLAEIEHRLRGVPVFTVMSGVPGKMHVLHRGDVRQPRDEVMPGGLSLLMGADSQFELDGESDDLTRRRKLADWVADPANTLLRRVAVNRVWHHHFGRGLVEKTSDFGFNGGRPSHPELLEWLAAWFQDHDHSLKQLHRLIVTSETWQQSSAAVDNPTAAKAIDRDASNRLLWRQNPRRLTAEMLRDGLLQISGDLHRAVGGEGFRDFDVETIGLAHYYRHREALEATCLRRSIYRFRVRGDRSPLLESFDCPDPSAVSPVRNVTTTPIQALTLWNHEWTLELSSRLADRIRSENPHSSSLERAEKAWRVVLQRKLLSDERAPAAALIDEHGLEALIRVLFNTNEFLIID